MPELVLVNDGEKYGGLFVATRTFQDKDVLVSGTDPLEVYNAARKKGVEHPVVFYVPEKDVVQVY